MKQGNAIALIGRVREKANRFIVQQLEARGIQGIVPSHGAIMHQLFDGQKHTMKELANKIHRTKPTVTVLVDKLIEQGYVIKEKGSLDKRENYISLTKKGLDLKPSFQEVSQELNALVYRNLSDHEAVLLEKILASIDQSFGK